MRLKFILIAFTSILFFQCKKRSTSDTWSLILKQEGKEDIEVVKLPDALSVPFACQKEVDGIKIRFALTPKGEYAAFQAVATKSSREAAVFFSLRCNYEKGKPYNFNGEVKTAEIFRQSPHDVNAWIVKNIAEQAVPLIALKEDSSFAVAISSSPAHYANFTTQSFFPSQKLMELSSGDDGKTPGLKPDTSKQLNLDYNAEKKQIFTPGRIMAHYHSIEEGRPHTFEGILFKTNKSELKGLRSEASRQIADCFSNGKYKDYFGALSFTTAYMNLRTNDSKKSKYWVIPAVEYGNTQYCRDAFWISTMLEPVYSAECIKSELDSVNNFAEYPLFAIIWAYRANKDKIQIDFSKVQRYVDAIEKKAKDGWYYSYDENDGRLDFQYWGDVIAFEIDDVVTYNQGLFALAIQAAQEMGLKTKTSPQKAMENYKGIFNESLGFFPISKKKNMIMGPDPLVPDLLAQVYFKQKLLDSDMVKRHYDRMLAKSKTSYGFKIVSMPDGEYLPAEQYDIKNYVSQVNREKMPDGRYFRGGSYFLYDNLFLIDAYLHGIKEAEDELVERVSLDFKMGSTTYECLNTKTGEPWKPNMGWNVAIYSIWRKLVDDGRASGKLFKKVDEITSNR